jgi:TonB-dependent SusC/RagA subfamily outer membrane receptor
VETATTQLTIEEALAYLNAASYSNTPAVIPTPDVEIPWIKILEVIYLIGFTVALLRFAISFIRMSRIIHQTKKIRLDDNSLLCISDKKVSPFSWMKFVVLSKDDFTDDSKDIIRHEQAHVAFGHSYDLLFLDVYSLVFWFNPFAWLLRLELQNIHEYQADEKVLAEGANAKNYHLSLIRQCVGEYKFALANNFEYNNLHKRIKMTLKTKSSSRQKWLYGTIGLSVMLCIVVLSFNGLKAKAADLKEMIQSELLPTDSIKKSTPAVVRIRKVAVNDNETVTPQIIIRDTVAPDSKIKVRLSPNEDIRVVGYGNQLAKDVEKNGITTWNGTNPLTIVDGKESSMSSVNIQDVSSISILKDASATATYGDKGKDGVILVTTKEYAASHKNEEIRVDAYETIKGLLKNADKEMKIKAPPSSIFDQAGGPKPLMIIDGVESSQNIDPNNIDNISVMKGKFAVEKYGDKGKNGVVVVTTKKNANSSANEKIIITGKTEIINTDTDKKQTNKNLEVRVAGYGTLNGAKPLIIVDGKEYFQSINAIKPDDISSISVMKDASSTAVYGNKGKNGVILITTKEYAASHEKQTNKKGEIRVMGYGTIDNGPKSSIIVDGVESSPVINPNSNVKIDVSKIVDFGGLKGAKPLIMVDGEEAPDNFMKNIVPENIESITVLKDSSATAIYKTKGKNGVILVKTKKK